MGPHRSTCISFPGALGLYFPLAARAVYFDGIASHATIGVEFHCKFMPP
ncbi:hypothetical protein T03_779 [Trichinella britovi]|uniref:Uncharacterized protein n=1 Tax=Trichinella britovi TaxID=45882 RepID=A0A0V1AGW8_TRIBR|nr:hypothetical protein T03_779 [Trichinella britovi]